MKSRFDVVSGHVDRAVKSGVGSGVGLVSARPSMTAGGAAIKAGGPSNLLRKSVTPPPLRGACASLRQP